MPPARRPQPPAWFLDGACRGADPTLFFPPDGSEPDTQRVSREDEAKAYCGACIIRASCLEWSVENGEQHGIWGGLTEEERTPLRKQARRAAFSPGERRLLAANAARLDRSRGSRSLDEQSDTEDDDLALTASGA